MTDPITILSSGGLSAVLVYLVNSWYKSSIEGRIKKSIEHEYEKKLADYSAKLKQQNDLELEAFKGRLAVESAERNIRLTKTFDDMADVIVKLYKIVVEMKAASHDYLSSVELGEPHRKAAYENYRTKVTGFLEFYLPNKIYFPPSAVENIKELTDTIQSMVMHTNVVLSRGVSAKDYESQLNAIDDASRKIPVVLEALEKEFQKLLGLHYEQTNT